MRIKHINSKNFRTTGLALIELLIVLSILSIIMALSLPDLSRIVHTNKIEAVHTALLSALGFTRDAAISRAETITLCNKMPYSNQCDERNKHWRYGWIIYSDNNENKLIEQGEEILLVHKNNQPNIFVDFNRSYIRYKALGFASGYAGTFSVCDRNDFSFSKQAVVAFNGRVRSATKVDNSACIKK